MMFRFNAFQRKTLGGPREHTHTLNAASFTPLCPRWLCPLACLLPLLTDAPDSRIYLSHPGLFPECWSHMCPSHPDPCTNSACPQPKSSPSTGLPSPLSFLHGGISATRSRARTLPPHQVHLMLCPFFLVHTPSRRPPLSVVLPGRSLDHQHLLVGWVTDSLQRGASASNLLTVLSVLSMLLEGPYTSQI